MAPRQDLLVRFYAKVDQSAGPDACWPWMGAFNTPKHPTWQGTRRPVFWVAQMNGKGSSQLIVYATRFILCLTDGVPLSDREGLHACHRCHNPGCVNPAHLYWGTREENVQDRVTQQRRRRRSG